MKNFNKLLSLFMVMFCISLGVLACSDNREKNDSDSNNIIEKCRITFIQQGEENIVYEVIKGESLNALPQITVNKKGYTGKWSISDFSNITEDKLVTVIFIKNKYKITYNLNGVKATMESLSQTVEYDCKYELLIPHVSISSKYEFKYWKMNDGTKIENGTYLFDKNIELIAVWTEYGPEI